eukprot:TRINITY_DN18375_c0_g1_i1.p1 TRINITY_DN18375_c0_g1~~TRINITY_DN18375_c0_g1_i1.p1  ORF type:complete len:534 (+),score=78.59 TRINITY_DN18375_c0_g1_i1:50-1651(+)
MVPKACRIAGVAGALASVAVAASDTGTCDVSVSARVDCGMGDEKQCTDGGCCWMPVDPNPDGRPWCFKKSEAPPLPPQPQGRSSTFVHLFEWSWADIALECEQWLGPKGFTGVQISPPNEHIAGDQWWTRYQPVTYNLVSRSGDEASFKDMVQRCKQVGVSIYADAVINHIAASSGTSIAGNSYGNRATPIYTQEDMHHNQGDSRSNCGIDNYADKHNVQYCDLSGLPDLCTGCQKVQQTIAAYLNHLASLGVEGFRIDAAKHQDAAELAQLLTLVNSSMWRFGEVISGAGEAVKPDMYFSSMDVTEFNYARQLVPNLLADNKMEYLQSFGTSWGLMSDDNAVVFVDNHDTQRGEAQLTYKNPKLYQFANIFMLAHPYGYPKVMSSYFFDSHDQGPPKQPVHNGQDVACGNGKPWVCEHRWVPVANMVGWRKSAGSSGISIFEASGDSAIAFCRGNSACILMNRQESSTWTAKLTLSLAPGKYCDVIQSDDESSCPTVIVAPDGSVSVNVPPVSAVAIHVGKTVAIVENDLVV